MNRAESGHVSSFILPPSSFAKTLTPTRSRHTGRGGQKCPPRPPDLHAPAYTWSMPIFLTVLGVMLAADALWWHRADRFLRPLPGARWWRAGLGAFMGGQIFLLLWTIGARWVAEGFDQSTPVVLIAATYIWHLLALPALALLWVLVSLFGGLRAFGRRVIRALSPPVEPARDDSTAAGSADPVAIRSPTRRQVLGAAAAAAPPLLTGIAAVASMPGLDEFRVRPLDVPIPDLPTDLDG